jgi:hypothetical protein
MYEIIILLFDICRFKKGPQDLPYSLWLLRLLFIVYVVIRVLMLSIHYDTFSVLLQIMVDIFMVAGFVWIMLYMTGKLGRLYQGLSAVLGTDAMISFFALPGMASMEIGRGGLLVLLVMLALIGWNWAVTGYIISKVLEKTLSFSLGLAFLYLLGSYQVMAFLFPEVAGVK